MPFTVRLFTDAVHSCPSLHRHITFLCVAAVIVDGLTRLKTGETQRPNGTYAYRWSTPDGKRHSIYAPTLEKLREQEEQIIVDKHDGIRSDVKSITVNEMFDLWCQLKRGIKDSTFKNYIYMYELFVKPSFGKNRLVQVKKSDVRKFYGCCRTLRRPVSF